MEEVDCERMEEKDVLHTADELTDFVELYNGKRMNGWMNEFALKQVFAYMFILLQIKTYYLNVI